MTRPEKRRTIFTITRSFRTTDTLSEQIDALADKARKHPADLMRDAVAQFVKFRIENPDRLEVTP